MGIHVKLCFKSCLLSCGQRQYTHPPSLSSSSTPKTNRLNTLLPVHFLHICRKTFLTRLIPNLEECWWEKQVTGLCGERAAARGTPAQESTPFQHLHPSITAQWLKGHSHNQHFLLDMLLQWLPRASGLFASHGTWSFPTNAIVLIFTDVPEDIHYALSFFSFRSSILTGFQDRMWNWKMFKITFHLVIVKVPVDGEAMPFNPL